MEYSPASHGGRLLNEMYVIYTKTYTSYRAMRLMNKCDFALSFINSFFLKLLISLFMNRNGDKYVSVYNAQNLQGAIKEYKL